MQSLEAKPLLLDVHRITLRLTSEEFEKLCQDNPDRSFELTATGELIVMPPVGGESGNSELELGLYILAATYRMPTIKIVASVAKSAYADYLG